MEGPLTSSMAGCGCKTCIGNTFSSWGALEPLISSGGFDDLQTQLSTDTSILINGGSSIDANELAAKFLHSDSGVIYVAFDTSIDSTLRGWWLDVLAATDAIIEPEFAIVEATDLKRQLTIKQVESEGSASGMYRYQYTYRDINGKRIYERIDPSNYSISIAESAYTHASSFANSQEAGWKRVAFHELGHALGLEHPHDWSDGDGDNEINTNNTVMSYKTVVSDDGNPQFEQLDQAALIEIHGKETGQKSTPISGSKLVTDLGPRTIDKTWKGGALSVRFSAGAFINEPSSGLTKTQLLIKREDANIENSIKVNLNWKFGDNLKWHPPTGYSIGFHDFLMDSPWQVEFAANQETIAVDLWIVGDTKKEADEWIEVTVDGAYNFSSWPTLPTRLTITEEPVSLKSTYILTPFAATINEGAVFTNTVTTTNVASGTKLYYALSGTGITAADFSAGALSGEGTTDSAGKFTFLHTIKNDLTTEGAESLVIKLYSDSARTLQVGATANVIISDTSVALAPTYSLTPSSATISEGATLTTSVTTTNIATGTKLYYALSGTGITAADFSAGALSGEGTTDSAGKFTFSYTIKNDLTTEGAESLVIKLYSDSARTLQVGATAMVNIVDTSVKSVMAIPPSVISVIAIANGKETDGSPVVFSFSRTGDTNTALSVSYQLFGTAQAGSDYTGKTIGTVSFAAGSSTATLSLPAIADGALNDPYETIIARINPGANYGITPGKQFATATITAEGMVVIPKGVRIPGRSSGEQTNQFAFAALKSDGSVVSWGEKLYGGNAPAGLTGVIQIFTSAAAFAALRNDGSVVSWGSKDWHGGSMTAPLGLTGVIQIFSNPGAFTALTNDGSVVSWGNTNTGGEAPVGLTGVSQVFSTDQAFAALKSDGSVICWGSKDYGGSAPAGLTTVSQIFSTGSAFAALKSDGSVICWGDEINVEAPAGLTEVIQISSGAGSFAALKSDGSVVSWGGASTPALTGVSQIFSTSDAFAALKSDGSVVSWGTDGPGAPAGLSAVSQIFSNEDAFAALKSDGSVVSWGLNGSGGSLTAPAGLTGVIQIFSTKSAFAALKSDGSVVSWGDSSYGGIAPAGLTGVSQIFSNQSAFAALKSDGSIVSWGDKYAGGVAPAGLTGVVGFANPFTDDRLVINGISSSYSYYSSTVNKALKDWNIYRVDNSIKAGDIVNQWFGVETPVALQVQDPTESKLLDITTSSWTEKVKINRVAKASDKGDFIEGKQKDSSSTDIVGSVLTGGKGKDSIQAKAGWDMVDGGEGDDLVKTGNGRDILTGGTGRDELWGGFGWNTYKGDKDGFSDLIVIKSDQHLPNPTLGNKSGNNSDGLKTDIIENLDSIDKLIIQGVATNQITFASNATVHGLTGIGIYSKGFIEALYTGGDLSVAQLTAMTTGDTSAAVMNNTLTSYGVW